MKLYWVIFVCLMSLSFIEIFTVNRTGIKKYIIYLFSFVFIILSTIYCGHAGDYDTYKYWFGIISNKDIGKLFGNQFEPLYMLANIIAKNICNHYWFLRMILAIIVMTIWNSIYLRKEERKVKESDYPFLTLLTCWSLQFGNIFIIRSTVTVALCLYSIRFIQKKQLNKFIIVTLCALGFHYMAIVWFLAYPVYYIKMKRRVWYFLILISAPISIVLPDLVLRVSNYIPGSIGYRIRYYIGIGNIETFGNAYGYSTQLIKALLNIIVVVFVFEICIWSCQNENHTLKRYFNLYMFGVLIYISSFSLSLAMSRAATMFTLVQILVLPELFNISWIKRKSGTKAILFGVFTVYLGLRMYVQMKNGYVPFQNILDS